VRIHFDWRLARVIDSDGNVIDELVWSGKRSVGALADRLAELQSGRLSPEARVLAERFSEGEADHLGAMSEAIPHLNAALEGRYTVERELGRGGMATRILR